MPTMKLTSVVNPGNSNQMVVTRNSSPPASPRDVGTNGAIYSGDQIASAASASATVVNVDNSDNWIATMDGIDPVDTTFNWEEVSSVDEYYNTQTNQYDYYVNLPDSQSFVMLD